jgi:hypothetical protein
LVLTAVALGTLPLSSAAQSVAPTLDLAAVRVEITWIADRAELAEIRRKYETRTSAANARQQRQAAARLGSRQPSEAGFSVLGKRNGEHVCLIFVERPTVVNDAHTLQLGHELAHCLLGAYHP